MTPKVSTQEFYSVDHKGGSHIVWQAASEGHSYPARKQDRPTRPWASRSHQSSCREGNTRVALRQDSLDAPDSRVWRKDSCRLS